MKTHLLTHPLLMYSYTYVVCICIRLGILEITREAVDRFRDILHAKKLFLLFYRLDK